jgi:D-proline reductase (dithiol) PrdB
MGQMTRWKNRILASLGSRYPAFARWLSSGYDPLSPGETPWAPVDFQVSEARLALVTTAGVHHRNQRPFDMDDPEGDPEFREIDGSTIFDDYTITHDYYDHRDADRDLNVVFPLERLRTMAEAGVLGGLTDAHYSFMGHIDGRHIDALVRKTAPEVARRLHREGADAVLLTPG